MTSPVQAWESLDFTLKYAGPLVSSQSAHHRNAKASLRHEFNLQLAVLWRVHPYLKKLDPGLFERQPSRKFRMAEVAPSVLYESDLRYRCLLGGIDYVPIVTYGHRAHCHLAIRLHSRREPGGIIHSGADMDNRLKVLLDALTIPNAGQESPTGQSDGTEDLVYCLLEDDELVTKLSIETFRLLKDEPTDHNYVEVDIDIHVVPISPAPYNYPLLVP
ncbi:MAG: hypothetical protein ACR2OG_07405 [Gemmatimonadaceae bacterium]